MVFNLGIALLFSIFMGIIYSWINGQDFSEYCDRLFFVSLFIFAVYLTIGGTL
jgi:hypothetical protein